MERLTKFLWPVLALMVALALAASLPRPAVKIERVETAWDGGVARVGGRTVIDLNRADAALLTAIPGIGPVLAARIEAYIQKNGALKAPEELLNVEGVGPEKLRAIEAAAAIG